ncbi:MAG: GFA family protein, partial [Novosphingobium sp.]
AVTATISAEPIAVRQCWCRQCQKIAAGGPTTNALFPTEAIATEGDLNWFRYQAESGNTVEQGCCASCGTPVIGRSSGRKNACVIRLGFIEPPHDLKPAAAIWLDDAPEWAMIDPALDQLPRQAPTPPPAG